MTDRELPPGRLSDIRLAWAGSMRRARLRRETEVLRYRLAMRIGGWLIREEQAELDALRSQIAEVRKARTYSRSSMGRVYDYVRGSDLDRILDGPLPPPLPGLRLRRPKVADRDLKRILQVHDHIARIYADDRFPPADHFGDLRMLAITITWVLSVERAPKGERFRRVCEVMHLDNFSFWELIRVDLPRYEPERGSDTGLCEAPMIRREGACGKHGMQGFHVTNPNDGTWRLVSYCSRHRDVADKVYAAERERKQKGVPEPLPNRGGLLPCYVRWNWEKNYKLARSSWEPPKVGICADDWPVMAKVVEASSAPPPPLRVVFGGRELDSPPVPSGDASAPELKLVAAPEAREG
jgi:hypothetical protein